MFDTVHFRIDRCNISGCNPSEMLHYLSDVTEWKNEKWGYGYTGKAQNYIVNVSENGISLKGSLAKFHLGNNIETLTRHTTNLAIEQLSDHLHLDLNLAKVTRLDISTVIPTQRPPTDYFRYLGKKKHFERVQYNSDTLYYENHQRKIVFYDKAKEAKKKGVQIPETFKNNNLLRYELSYTKRVKTQFETLVTDVTASTITDEVFYRNVIQNWYNEYKTIQKLKPPSFIVDNITTITEAETALFAYLLQQSGITIDEYISELKAKNVFKDRQRYSELNIKLNKKITASTIEQQNELMQELGNKIFAIAKSAM